MKLIKNHSSKICKIITIYSDDLSAGGGKEWKSQPPRFDFANLARSVSGDTCQQDSQSRDAVVISHHPYLDSNR